MQEERSTLDRSDPEVALVCAALRVKYAHDTEALAKVGLALPRKRRKMTGEEMVAKAAKAKATREGRSASPAATPPNPITPPVAPAPVVVNGSTGSH